MKCAILAGCAVFFSGSICFSADTISGPTESNSIHRVSVPTNLQRQQIQPWLNSIKPSAGNKNPIIVERKEYWQQTVNRTRRNKLRE